MKRILMTFAAMLLVSISAFAQSNEPLEGDVNNDGVVDVADIVKIIDIMQSTQPQTTYYWYVGTENPSSIDVSNLQTESNVAGWHSIGNSIDGFSLTFNNQNLIEFESKTQYYLVIPNDLHVYAADGNTNVETAYFNTVTSNIENYKTYQYQVPVWEVKGLVIKE